ncbi:MAG: hypothetical protein FWH26_07765 [Oscillospiraceae bacterium]|nr:hypothetical protein [Oscillospiraceae bacterium]
MRLKITKRMLLLVIAAALVVAAVPLIFLLARRAGAPADQRYAVLYSKGGQQLFFQTQSESVTLQARESKRQTLSSHVLFYDAVTEDGLALYACDLRSGDSRETGGRLIAPSVEENWSASADGRYAVYLEGKKLQIYDRDSQSAQEISGGVEGFYAAAGQPVFFFTKLEGEQRLLYRCVMGQTPERMAVGLEAPHFYADGNSAILLFLRGEGEFLTLSSLSPTGGIAVIAEEPSKVFFEEYEIGGNLYYLRQGQTVTGVSVVLDDPQETADALLKEPRREDYWSGFFTRVIGDEQYNRDLATYREKQNRDDLRARVKKILQEQPNQLTQQDCYSYDGETSQLLASGVDSEHLLLTRAFGRPMLVYQKFRVIAREGAKTVTLDELAQLNSQKGGEAVAERLRELAQASVEPAGYYVAMKSAGGSSEIELSRGFDTGWKLHFMQSPDVLLYQEQDVQGGKYTLYAYDIMEYGISERRMVDSGVTELLTGAQGAYYRKNEAGEPVGSLYYLNGTQSKKLVHKADAFFFAGSGSVKSDSMLAISGVKDQVGSVYRCDRDGAEKIADGVKADSPRSNGAQLCYLSQWNEGRGLLFLHRPGKSDTMLDSGVTSIIAVL